MLLSFTLATPALPQKTGSISGFISDASDGETLIGATVFLQGTYMGAVTNISGYYVIPSLPEGRHTLVCTYIGYDDFTREIEVASGQDLKLDIELRVEAIEVREIVIHADSMRTSERLFEKPISEIRLSARQINGIPQVAEADLMRSLQNLPGVLPLSDVSSALYVRGGTPDQNLYLLDGTDVYNPEHAFGIFSTFNTDAIKQAELSKGGFGAEYGGRLSSVLDVTNLDGNREEFEGTAAISLLSAKATLQAPLGNRGSVSGSIRRTYFDQTVGRSISDIPEYYFYDGNLKVFLDLDDNNKVTISGYGGRDFLDVTFNPDATEDIGLVSDWGNKTGSVRWTRVFSPQLFSTFWVTGSRFSSDVEFDFIDFIERNFVSDMTLKGKLEHHHSKLVTNFGFEQKFLNVRFTEDFPEGLIDVQERPEHLVLYGSSRWRPSILWEVETGLRYNLFRSSKTFNNIAPRFSAKYRLTDTANLRAAAGVYYQYLHRIPRFIVTDIWTTSNEFQDESRSLHAILGWQQEIARNYQFEIEGFVKGYDNIYAFNQTFLPELQETGHDDQANPIFTNTFNLFNRGDGNSAGVEIMLRKDSGAVSGWLAYSLSRTKYKFDDINQERSFFPRHDRTSTVNLVSKIDLRNAWRKAHDQKKRHDPGKWILGVNCVYGTGQPLTEPSSGYLHRTSPVEPGDHISYAPTVINNIRIPAYARLDLGITYSRDFGTWSMAPYLQIFNSGNRRNVWFVDYGFNNGRPDIDTISQFPLLPTIGANFTF